MKRDMCIHKYVNNLPTFMHVYLRLLKFLDIDSIYVFCIQIRCTYTLVVRRAQYDPDASLVQAHISHLALVWTFFWGWGDVVLQGWGGPKSIAGLLFRNLNQHHNRPCKTPAILAIVMGAQWEDCLIDNSCFPNSM